MTKLLHGTDGVKSVQISPTFGLTIRLSHGFGFGATKYSESDILFVIVVDQGDAKWSRGYMAAGAVSGLISSGRAEGLLAGGAASTLVGGKVLRRVFAIKFVDGVEIVVAEKDKKSIRVLTDLASVYAAKEAFQNQTSDIENQAGVVDHPNSAVQETPLPAPRFWISLTWLLRSWGPYIILLLVVLFFISVSLLTVV